MTRSPRELVLGLDFGMTYSSAGVHDGSQPRLVVENGDSAIPSVAWFPPRGEPDFGTAAFHKLSVAPERTVRGIKRILGTVPTDRSVRLHDASCGYKIVTGPNGRTALQIGGDAYTPEQVVSVGIRRLKELAEKRFACRVRRMVATVPASPWPGYEQGLARAARLAHLEVIETIPEPIAGVLALGLHLQQDERILLVCDFGGGTFDVTIAHARHRALDIVSCLGDSFLGGDDFDHAMAQAIAGVIYRQTSYEILNDALRHQQLLIRCELAKRALSTKGQVHLKMKNAYLCRSQMRDLDVLVDREWIEPRWQPLVDRALEVVRSAIQFAGISREDVGEIALIGGTSQVPCFRKALAKEFPHVAGRTHVGGSDSVVRGAVLRANALQGATAPKVQRLDLEQPRP